MATDPTEEPAPPNAITLEDHARISAEIAEGDRPLAKILEARDLTEAAWNEATMHWMGRIGDDVQKRGEHATLALVYSDAFGAAQSALKPLPPTDAASYAKLVVDVQAAGGPAEPLAVRGMSLADYTRLSRHWATVLSSDPVQAKLFFDMFRALQPE